MEIAASQKKQVAKTVGGMAGSLFELRQSVPMPCTELSGFHVGPKEWALIAG